MVWQRAVIPRESPPFACCPDPYANREAFASGPWYGSLYLFCQSLQHAQQAARLSVFPAGCVCHQHRDQIRNSQLLAFQDAGRQLLIVGIRRAIELNQLLLRSAEG